MSSTAGMARHLEPVLQAQDHALRAEIVPGGVAGTTGYVQYNGSCRRLARNDLDHEARRPGPTGQALFAVLLVSLVAVFALVAGSATVDATPGWASVGNDVAPVAAGPQSALPGRLVPGGPLSGDGAIPAGHPGPVLEALLLAPPAVTVAGPAGTVGDHSATAGLDPGHGSRTDPRGPPAV